MEERIFGKIKSASRKLDGKRACAKLMSALLIASYALNAVTPIAARAAEPQLATVSLDEAEHGKLSFDGTDEMTLAVEVGTPVTVDVNPDEGYFSDGITVLVGDDEGKAVDVKDGKATFTVEGDTIVTSTFYENGSVGSAALKPVEVDEGKAVKSVEDYIRKNANEKYVGKSDDLTRADVLTVTTTVVDGNKLPEGTLDALWADDDGDGMSDHWDAMLSQAVSHAVLFEVDPDSDYYVGWAGDDISGAKLTDWAAAENNADAKMRDGFIVDDATGLVYVPKSYTERNEKGEPMVASSRIQLVYTTSDKDAVATFDFNASADKVSGDVSGKGKVTIPAISPTTEVVLANDDAAREAVNGRTIDSVTVNGIEYTPDMGMWQYDSETGALEFAMAPAGIHAMSVKMSDNFGKDVASFFRMPEPRMSVNDIGTFEFTSAPYVGQTFRTQGKNRYTGKKVAGYTLPAVENPSLGNYESKTVNQAMGWQPVDLSKLKSGNYSIERTADVWAQDTGTVKISQEAHLALTCGHVGVNQNFDYDPNYNEDAATEDTLGQHFRVFSVSGDEAIVGVTVPTSHTQAGSGFFKIRWRVVAGKLNIHKSSANTSITDGNDCYSLEGAEFTVYNAAGQSMGVLTTNANGDTGTLELPEGTYTVRETKAPKGYLAAPDQQVTVSGGQQTTAQVSDQPTDDPVSMMIGKFDGDKKYNANNLPQGSAKLEGAEFTVEYYDTVDYGSYDAIKDAGLKPTRSWVVRTNEKGYASLSEQFVVSGDELYHSLSGDVCLPRGSVAVYESKAPEGYKLNNEVNFQKIDEDFASGGNITYNAPQVPEPVIRGGVSVQKLDSETGKTPQGGASLKGIGFSIVNDNENTVKVDGKTYAKGETVKVITTDAKGFATTGADCLPYGDYIIRETGTNDSYLNTSAEMRVQVREDGKVYSFSAKDEVERGGVKLVKTDSETGDPQNGLTLDGAQFELKSLNDNPVIVNGVSYSKGQVIQTLTIKDGQAATDARLLPYGTYSVQEVKAPEGYVLDDTVHEFRITEDGAVVNPIEHDGPIKNQIMRSDLEFTKKGDADSDRLAGVAFKLTSNATGESHVVVTDENGYFSSASSWNKHTDHTNGNDWALKTEGTIDSSKLDATAGVWFGDSKADDSKGALPYGTYTIEELRCTANEGYQLIETTVIVSRDGKVYDFGTLTDVKAAITTKAYDPVDGDTNIGMGTVKVADKVTYSNLIPDRSYKLVAELHDSKTGDALKGADGKAITVEKTFTASQPTGFEVIELDIDTIDLGGKTVTVYERLYDDGNSLIAEHTDKSDVNQQVTVIVPEIGTTAVDGADGDKDVSTDDKATVTDRVAYKNLVPGKEYTVKGTLHIKKTDGEGKVTEEALEVDSKPVTAETTFTPDKAEGTVDVTFTFDSLSLKDKTHLVAFESLEHEGRELAAHADIEDEGQTVTIRNPRISTTALDGIDKDKNIVTDDETVIIDTVSYENLVPGKEYTLKGSVQVKKTGEDGKVTAEPLEADGKPVKAEATFTPEKSEGTANVTFQFSSRDIKPGTELVMFETLERDGKELASHEDIGDVNQTVTVTAPSIATEALDGADGDKNVVTDDQSTIVDTVAYQNLVPGKPYVVKGQLYLKSTGDPLMVAGKPVKAEAAFTPDKAEGTVDVTFTFDSREIEDKTDIVVFESLERCGTEIASHEDIGDGKQTVTVTHPEIGTTASDGSDGDKNVITDDATEVIDTVEYTGLIPGKEYTVKGTLHVKKTDDKGKVTEEILKVDGKPVTAETTFTPEKADGKVDVVFRFNSLTIPHDTEIVAFESLERDGVEIAAHADIEDKGQTVTVKHPFITTSALDGIDGDKNVVTDDETVIVDTVKYSGLIPGREYTLKGSMQVKKSDEDGNITAEPLEVDGEPVTAETTFTPETASGEVDVTFTFDSRAIANKTDIVVFESLERTGVEIASHEDIEDGKQTTTVTRPQIGTTALDGHDGDKNVVTDGKTTVIDTVEYKNVIPGKTYTLKGSLHVKVTDGDGNVTEKALEVDGKPVTAETTFTPEKADGKVEVTFTFDSTGIPQDTEMVAFESLEKNGVELTAHADIEDGKQTTTAHVTGISTTATDGLDGDKNVIADAETTITDEVAYENALTGTGYTMAGILMDADTGLPILTGDGSEKYSENDVAKFMQKLLDVLGIASTNEGGKDYLDVPVSQKTADGVTKSQSVRVHADGTYEVVTSENGMDGDGLGYANMDTSGSIGYDRLTDEQKAAISNVAVLPEAGIILDYTGADNLPADIDTDALDKLIADNGDLISHLVFQKSDFTPEKYDGTVPMDFQFNANDVIDRLGGETKDIVVFEVMFKNGAEGTAPVIVASECDLDCDEQTVNLVPSVISTTATDKSDGDHTLMAGKDAVITDRVAYEGLIPGKEYTLKATLMDKETGEALSIDDQHVTAELKFTPNSQNGTVDIDLGKFDATSLDGHDLVVFEELYKQTGEGDESTDVLVAEHKDIDDDGQTVTVTSTPPGGFFGKTGGNSFFITVTIAALVVLAGGCAYYAIKTRRSAKADAPSDADGTGGGDSPDDSEA